MPYKGSAAIPFIVYDPGNLLGIKQGNVLDNVVELRDVMPSLLDMAGVDIPQNVEGASILPLLKGEEVLSG